MRSVPWMSCPSHPIFRAFKEDLTAFNFFQHLSSRLVFAWFERPSFPSTCQDCFAPNLGGKRYMSKAYWSTSSRSGKKSRWWVQIAQTLWLGWSSVSELLSHGYAIFGKGTVQPLVPVLEFETDMYKSMNTIQGKAIAVYLGRGNLASALHLTARSTIVHLMLLSWANEEAWRCGIQPEDLPWDIHTHHTVASMGV